MQRTHSDTQQEINENIDDTCISEVQTLVCGKPELKEKEIQTLKWKPKCNYKKRLSEKHVRSTAVQCNISDNVTKQTKACQKLNSYSEDNETLSHNKAVDSESESEVINLYQY